ncbi:TraI [Legionella donaldsonii]|uniref:TraI n=1 Tax=Legionella donaldsonii TaxID=45060 RepID=A0A378KI29_9GAMM|nr:TraI [Legionella donaldsonii]
MWKAIDDNGTLYDKINKIPALLIAAKNKQGEITGVQRIYLDEKNAKKNTFMENAKLSKGRIEGSAGVLQTGEKRSPLYLAEGPETGATIAMANPKATVLVSFGLSNLKNLSALIKSFYPSEVIIAGDNDLASKNNTAKITEEAKEALMREGLDIKIIMPQNLPGREKTDWNDVHCSQGLNQVKHQLGLNEINPEIHKIAVRLNNEKSLELEQYVNNFIEIKNQLGKAILPKNYNVDYLNTNKGKEPHQRSFEIEKTKELQRNQKEMDIEL